MLVVTNKYTLREVKIGQLALWIVLIALVVYIPLSFFDKVPRFIEILISLVLGICGSLIWELYGRKDNKILSKEGLESFINTLINGGEQEVKELVSKYIKVRNKNKRVLNRKKSSIADEIYLVSIFYFSSFYSLKRLNVDSKIAKEIFPKLTNDKSILVSEYNVDWDSLCYFYMMNIKYFYFIYGIGHDVNFKIEITNENQKIIDYYHNLSDNFFWERPKEIKYYLNELLAAIEISRELPNLFLKNEYEEFLNGIRNMFSILKTLYHKIENQYCYFPLKQRILNKLYAAHRVLYYNDLNLESHYLMGNTKTVKESLDWIFEMIKEHKILHYFILGSVKDWEYYSNNYDGFEFHESYNYAKFLVLENRCNSFLLNRDYSRFNDAYNTLLNLPLEPNSGTTFQKEAFKIIYEHLNFGKDLNFELLPTKDFINEEKEMEEFLNLRKQRFIEYSNSEGEKKELLGNRIFSTKNTGSTLSICLMYQHFDFLKFQSVLMAE